MVKTRGSLFKSPMESGAGSSSSSTSSGRRLRSSRLKGPGDLYNRHLSHSRSSQESSALSQTGIPSAESILTSTQPSGPSTITSGGGNAPGPSSSDNNDLVIYGTRDSGVQTMVCSSPSSSPESSSPSSSNSSSVKQLPSPPASSLLSSSSSRPSTQLPEDLKINLECPVCGRTSLPPIMQCRNGHVTCNACRLKVQSCPVCREIDIDIRNMFAEKAITYLTIQCEFDQYGCKEIIQYRDKEAHERTCKYRPYICPYIECDHKLSADVVVDHVSSVHREECRRSDGPEITASMILIGRYFGGDGAWSPRVITCFGKTFFDVALTRDRWLHHWVWLLGEEEEAMKYLYEITAFKGNTRYVYGGEVASLRTTDDDIVSGGQCLSISDAIGRRLRDADKIRYKLKLMRKSDVNLKR
eukprot:TRINITY_DN5283_c0_g1_i1.p1 TRINITY_DN5283_c0_g1~~TRINITY_DN5283_c0_g1_i1.p1  ORF type:complete len:413 (+),score=124.01 TRINITY_DN5283_c0_g1_i1:143-1381(+)